MQNGLPSPPSPTEYVTWKHFTFIIGGIVSAAIFALHMHSHNELYLSREEFQQYLKARQQLDEVITRDLDRIYRQFDTIENRLVDEGRATRDMLDKMAVWLRERAEKKQ